MPLLTQRVVKQAGDPSWRIRRRIGQHKKFAAAVDAWRTGKTEEKAKSPTRDIAKQLNKQMEEARVRRIEKFNKENMPWLRKCRKQKTNYTCAKQRLWKKLQLRNQRWYSSHLSQRQTIVKYGTSRSSIS